MEKAKPNSHPPVVVLPYSGEDLTYKPPRIFLGVQRLSCILEVSSFSWILIILRPNAIFSLVVTEKILQFIPQAMTHGLRGRHAVNMMKIKSDVMLSF